MVLNNEPYMLSDDTALLTILELDPALKSHASDFLLYGGILAGHSDGNFSLEELAYLAESLSPLFDSLGALMDGLMRPEVAVVLFEETMGWLKENGNGIKYNLLRCIAGIVAADHVLRERERRFMQNVTRGLGISSTAGKQILSEALAARGAVLARKRNQFRNTRPLFFVDKATKSRMSPSRPSA